MRQLWRHVFLSSTYDIRQAFEYLSWHCLPTSWSWHCHTVMALIWCSCSPVRVQRVRVHKEALPLDTVAYTQYHTRGDQWFNSWCLMLSYTTTWRRLLAGKLRLSSTRSFKDLHTFPVAMMYVVWRLLEAWKLCYATALCTSQIYRSPHGPQSGSGSRGPGPKGNVGCWMDYDLRSENRTYEASVYDEATALLNWNWLWRRNR